MIQCLILTKVVSFYKSEFCENPKEIANLICLSEKTKGINIMPLEIERKFLVSGDFKSDVFQSDNIVQGYLNSSSERTVRVRVRNDSGFITVKSASFDDGLSRFEWEMEIPVEDARHLLELSEPTVIEKTRHLIHHADGIHTWEVDEFHGANEGLIVCEVELSSPDECVALPRWLGPEVTGDHRYSNSYLSQHPFSTW